MSGGGLGRWAAYLTGLTLPLFILSLAAVQLLYRLNVRPALESAISAQSEFLQSYTEDIQFLARFELLWQRSSFTRDAGSFLNTRLFWSPLPAEAARARAQVSLVPVKVREELLRLRGEWLEKAFKLRQWKFDLRFFNSLRDYDFWDLEVQSPIADLIVADRFVPPSQLPIPEVADLIAAAKLRLMMGALNGEAIRALTDVRELSRLMLTTENMQMVLAALAILDEERTAYRFYLDNNQLTASSWLPIDRNITRRARRAMKAARSYMHIWTPETMVNPLFLKGSALPPGFCAAGNETLPIDQSLRPLLGPHLPLEMDLRSNYSRLDAVFNRGRSHCRWRYMKALAVKNAFDIDLPAPLILSRLPYSRKVFGMQLSVRSFEGFEGYR
jgi:hypothetical protein